MKSNFAIDNDEPDKVFATYETPSYEGYALVIYKEGSTYSVVEGSHCSCYGLEGQFEPTEGHSEADILKMTEASYGQFKDYAKEIKEWLND